MARRRKMKPGQAIAAGFAQGLGQGLQRAMEYQMKLQMSNAKNAKSQFDQTAKMLKNNLSVLEKGSVEWHDANLKLTNHYAAGSGGTLQIKTPVDYKNTQAWKNSFALDDFSKWGSTWESASKNENFRDLLPDRDYYEFAKEMHDKDIKIEKAKTEDAKQVIRNKKLLNQMDLDIEYTKAYQARDKTTGFTDKELEEFRGTYAQLAAMRQQRPPRLLPDIEPESDYMKNYNTLVSQYEQQMQNMGDTDFKYKIEDIVAAGEVKPTTVESPPPMFADEDTMDMDPANIDSMVNNLKKKFNIQSSQVEPTTEAVEPAAEAVEPTAEAVEPTVEAPVEPERAPEEVGDSMERLETIRDLDVERLKSITKDSSKEDIQWAQQQMWWSGSAPATATYETFVDGAWGKNSIAALEKTLERHSIETDPVIPIINNLKQVTQNSFDEEVYREFVDHAQQNEIKIDNVSDRKLNREFVKWKRSEDKAAKKKMKAPKDIMFKEKAVGRMSGDIKTDEGFQMPKSETAPETTDYAAMARTEQDIREKMAQSKRDLPDTTITTGFEAALKKATKPSEGDVSKAMKDNFLSREISRVIKGAEASPDAQSIINQDLNDWGDKYFREIQPIIKTNPAQGPSSNRKFVRDFLTDSSFGEAIARYINAGKTDADREKFAEEAIAKIWDVASAPVEGSDKELLSELMASLIAESLKDTGKDAWKRIPEDSDMVLDQGKKNMMIDFLIKNAKKKFKRGY